MELMDAKADTSEGDSMKKFVGLIIIEGVIFGCARGAELMWPELSGPAWFTLSGIGILVLLIMYWQELRGLVFSGKHAVNADTANHHWETSQPSVTVTRAPFYKRMFLLVGKLRLKETFLLLALCVAFGSLAWTIVSYESPPWAHPTLSVSEQKQAIAECEMRSIQVSRLSRYEYKESCLASLGFVRDDSQY